MTVYLLGLLCSLLILFFAHIVHQIFVQRIIRIMSLLPLSIIAGLRDLTIGTDISNYGYFNFHAATTFKNLFEYLNYIKISNKVEIGYSLLNFVVSRFTNSINFFFFLLNFLTLLFIVLGLFEVAQGMSFDLGIITYYLIFWGTTLNIMRQSLAVAIAFFGIMYFFKSNNYLFYVAIILVATSIHQTALLALAIPLIYHFCSAKVRFRNVIVSLSIGAIIFWVMNPFNSFLQIGMEKIPVLDKYYSIFVAKGVDYITAGNGMSLKSVIIHILPMLIMLFIILIKKNTFSFKNSKFVSFAIIMLIIAGSFEFVNMRSGVLSRLGMYFSVIQIIVFPWISSQISKKERLFFNFIMLVYLFMFYIYMIRSGSGNIYPYTSQIMSNLL